jgi:hypothetical protein
MSVILATLEAEIRRISVWGQPKQKVHEIPFQPMKAGRGGVCPSSLLHGSCKYDDGGPGQPRHKFKTLFKK